jgi:hypothetical protein
LQDNPLLIRIKDQKLIRKCKLLSKLNRIVIETLLEFLFERVDVIDIQSAFLDGGEVGVKRLVMKILKEGEGKKEEVRKVSLKVNVDEFWQSG